jgi:hypothetical protein
MNTNIGPLFTQDLRELAAHQSPELDIDAIMRRGRALRRRRFALTGAGGSVVAAGVAAVLAVSASAAGPVGHTGAAARTPSISGLKAQLTAAISKAQATSKLTVNSSFAAEKGGSSTSETITVPSRNWAKSVTWNHAGGKQQVEFTTELAGTGTHRGYTEVKTLTINYPARTYATERTYTPAGHAVVIPWSGAYQPQSLKTTPWNKVVGTATVDGHRTFVLLQTGSGGFTETLWVDQTTLLPVKDVVHTFAGTTTDQYTWSPAAGASATAAANTPAIPAGFTGSNADCPAVPANWGASGEWCG